MPRSNKGLDPKNSNSNSDSDSDSDSNSNNEKLSNDDSSDEKSSNKSSSNENSPTVNRSAVLSSVTGNSNLMKRKRESDDESVNNNSNLFNSFANINPTNNKNEGFFESILNTASNFVGTIYNTYQNYSELKKAIDNKDETKIISLIQKSEYLMTLMRTPHFISTGSTPLHYAAENGFESLLGVLLGMKKQQDGLWFVDPNVTSLSSSLRSTLANYRDNNGDTPMHLAARKNYPMLAIVLASAGADFDIINNVGTSAKSELATIKNVGYIVVGSAKRLASNFFKQ